MPEKIRSSSLYLSFVVCAYAFSYTRVGLCLLFLHYVVEAVFHAARLLAYADKPHLSAPLFRLYDALFVLARLGSILLAVLTFWYGLALAPPERQVVDAAAGNFNAFPFRLGALVAVGLLQGFLMWRFITFHLKRQRENATAAAQASAAAASGSGRSKKTQQEKAKLRKEQKPKKDRSGEDASPGSEENESELPEVDQNTKKTLRQRK